MHGIAPARHVLVVPRAALDSGLEGRDLDTWSLLWGRATLCKDGDATRWLLAELRSDLPASAPPSSQLPWPGHGTVAVVVGSPRADGRAVFDELCAPAPASPSRAGRAPRLLLWLQPDGRAAACMTGAGPGQAALELRWVGAGMARVDIAQAAEPPAHAGEPAAGLRYSRVEGALGPGVLAHMQRSVFAVVGCGRTGSAVAHTLVRMGASVMLLDPDRVEPHNLDGDILLPAHEGLAKVGALARGLRPLLRPGAWVDARALRVQAPIVSRLLAHADVLVSTVDDDAARAWCAAWASAWLLPHLDIGVAVPLQGDPGADVRLTLPGHGCLLCCGGLAGQAALLASGWRDAEVKRPLSDFRQQRRGSLRSLGQTAAHLGMRLLEQLYAGGLGTTRAIRLAEDERSGLLRLDDREIRPHLSCHLCGRFKGQGPEAVDADALRRVLARTLGTYHVLR